MAKLLQNLISPSLLRAKHNTHIKKMGFPAWLGKLKCLDCGRRLGRTSIRGITLKTNAQHIGDVAVEVMCQRCKSSYDIHYRKCGKSFRDFAGFVNGFTPPSDPVASFDIPASDNNLLDGLEEGFLSSLKKS